MARSFSVERLRRLEALEDWHFWFVGRRALLRRLADRHLGFNGSLVLDIGCGTGSVLASLATRAHRVIAIDLLGEAVEAARRRVPSAKVILADAARLPLVDGAADTVLMLDVLEHVDDRAALAQVRRVLRPGGVAIIMVPVAAWLWSHRDEGAGHLRRYGRGQLLRTVEEAGLSVCEARYYQCLLFPLVLATRLLGRRGPRLRNLEERPPVFFNRVMAWITALEVRLGEHVAWPWGSSLAIVCRKP